MEGGNIDRGNYIHDNGELGMRSGNSSSALVDSYELALNNSTGFDLLGGWWGEWSPSINLTVQGTYVHDNYGWGLWPDNVYTR